MDQVSPFILNEFFFIAKEYSLKFSYFPIFTTDYFQKNTLQNC